MLVIAALFLITLLTVLLCVNTLWRCTYWQRQGIRATKGFPFVGNMWKFCLGRMHYGDVYQDIYNLYSELPYVGIYRIFNEPAVLLRSQSLIKEILIRNFQHFQNNVLWVDPLRDPVISCNPFIAKNEKWRQMRAEIMPVFTPNKVKQSFPHIKAICLKLQQYVETNFTTNCFEAKELFSKYTLAVIASAGYSLDAETFTNTNSDFTQLCEHLFLPNSFSLIETIALLFSPNVGNLINYRYVPTAVQHWLRSIINSVLDKRLSLQNVKAAHANDFIQWLIEAKQKVQEPVDAKTIVGHCSTFLLEGFETSASLMAFALYEYAINPLEQAKILREIDEVLRRYEGVLCYEALQQMSYFEASLYETLRLHPAMMALLKHCTKSFTLPAQDNASKDFVVPEGMVIVIPVKAVHCDASLYPDPLKFNPERFMAKNDKQRESCSFLGFGDGPRLCPGMRFALAQSKAGLVSLLSKYSVQLAPKTKVPIKISTTTFLTATQNGIWIDFKQRKTL